MIYFILFFFKIASSVYASVAIALALFVPSAEIQPLDVAQARAHIHQALLVFSEVVVQSAASYSWKCPALKEASRDFYLSRRRLSKAANRFSLV